MAGHKIGIIGCGSMGAALLKSFVENNVCPPSFLYGADANEERLKAVSFLDINAADNASLAKNCDIIILGVKPKDIPEVIKEIKKFISDGSKVLISIAAGISIKKIESHFEDSSVPVIRIMPNFNIKVNAGLLPYCLGMQAKKHKQLVETIFSSSGLVFELEEEKFDSVTALSGSGPGFMFFIAEIIESICRDRGFSPKEANLISSYVIYGSGKNLVETKTSPSVLKQRVA